MDREKPLHIIFATLTKMYHNAGDTTHVLELARELSRCGARVTLVASGKPLIKLLFGSAFLPSVMPLLILLPGIIALGGAKVLSADLAGRGNPQIGSYAAFTSLAINVPLNLYLIPKWGICGAAFASSVAYIVATLIVIIAFVKISRKSWLETLLIKKQDFRDYRNLLLKIRTEILQKYRKECKIWSFQDTSSAPSTQRSTSRDRLGNGKC